MAKLPPSQTIRGLLPEARRLVLPAGIASTAAPSNIAVAARIGLGLDPWQQDISRVTWGKAADGAWAADTVAMSIPRQTGKTYLVAAMVFAYCLAHPGVTVAWTAHHNKVMLETFASLKSTAGRAKVLPHVKATPSGAEYRAIEFVNGSRIAIAARESGALRGVPKITILVLDEAQIMSDDAMADMLPTQNQAERPLTIMMGTPPPPKYAGGAFARLREEAIAAERAGKPLELTAWIEFSADEDAATDDLEQLRKANPSYPKRTPLRAVRKLRRLLTEDHFRREALGIWDDKSTPMVIPAGVWAAAEDPSSLGVGRLVLGIDVAPSRDLASLAVAAVRADGRWHVELVRRDRGTGWIVDEAVALCADNPIAMTILDARSPAASLLGDLRTAGVQALETNADQMTAACSGFYDAAMQGQVRHTGQTQLMDALTVARKRAIGDRWAWNRMSATSDITPLVAATLALWGSRLIDDSPRRVRVMR